MTGAQPTVNIEACRHCADERTGHRDLSCVWCCVRLLRTAAPGGPRRAMYAHLMMFCTDEQIAAIRLAAEAEGLTKVAA